MEHLSTDHEDHPILHGNSGKLCDETGIPLRESQWKLRQQHTNRTNTRIIAVKQILVSEEINPKDQDCESHRQGSE